MPCDRCRELSVEYRIVVPGDLREALRIIGANIADGTLRAVHSTLDPQGSTSFEDVMDRSARDDIVSRNFQCCHCGQRFHLGVETYHGGGGSWHVCTLDDADRR